MKTSKMIRSILAVLLCAALCVSLFAACGGGNESSTGGSSSSGNGGGGNAGGGNEGGGDEGGSGRFGEGVTLTYWMEMGAVQAQKFTDMNDHPYYQWLEETTGVHIEFIHPSYEQKDQQMNMMIASQEYYDLLYGPSYPGGPMMGIREGCYVDLNPYLDEYMPEYKAALHCDDGSFADWEWGTEKDMYEPRPQEAFWPSCITVEGQLWCVTQIWTNAYDVECGPIIRKDWLDEAGLEMPETLDELETVLEAFKARGDDIVPMALGSRGYNGDTVAIASAFDLNPAFFALSKDKSTVHPHAYVQPAFKDYLTMLHDWYSKGYIDPDFMNRDYDSTLAMFLDGRLGIIYENWAFPSELNRTYVGDEEGFEAAAMPLPRKTKDQQLHFNAGYSSQPTSYTVITTSCEHPEVAAQWLNMGFTHDGILHANYGIEGETYELRDGVPYFIDSYVDKENFDGSDFYYCISAQNGSVYCSWRSSAVRHPNAQNEPGEDNSTYATWARNSDMDYCWVFTSFSDDGWGNFDGAAGDARTYADPMVLKFIIGEEDIEAKWDEFVETTKALGMDDAQMYAQEARDATTGKTSE